MRRENYSIQNANNNIETRNRVSKRKRKRAGKKKRVITLILIVTFVLFAGRMLTMEYKYYTLNKTKDQLSQQIEEENLKSKELNDELENSNSRSYIEYLAKKYLGLIYPDEKVYVTNEGDNK